MAEPAVHISRTSGLGADGGMPDIVYTRGKEQRVLDGDHKTAGMSRSAYLELVRETDEQYSALLTLLLDAVKAQRPEPRVTVSALAR